MRLNYPTNVKIVKVPCTGRVDVLLILKTFESGVDGVYLAGCLEGECHFLRGNLRAKKRYKGSRGPGVQRAFQNINPRPLEPSNPRTLFKQGIWRTE
jgi:hypothetical protein